MPRRTKFKSEQLLSMLSFVVKILLWSTSLGAAAARRRLTSSDYLNQYRDHATSRFILKTDDKIDELSVMPIKHTWWSRFYEYAWAKKFASEDHVVLDAAAGIPHMFKWFLAGKCQEIWAVDIDKRILDLPAIFTETSLDLGEKSLNALLDVPNIYNNINFVHGSITDLPKEDMPLFDRIFLVSVLEHMHIDDIVKALSEMKQVLKKNGLIVVTMDYPDRNPEDLVRAAAKSGLVPLGSVDYKVPTDSDALHNRQLDLKIFRLVLAHKSFLTTKDL